MFFVSCVRAGILFGFFPGGHSFSLRVFFSWVVSLEAVGHCLLNCVVVWPPAQYVMLCEVYITVLDVSNSMLAMLVDECLWRAQLTPSHQSVVIVVCMGTIQELKLSADAGRYLHYIHCVDYFPCYLGCKIYTICHSLHNKYPKH